MLNDTISFLIDYFTFWKMYINIYSERMFGNLLEERITMNEINKTQYFRVPKEVQPVVKDVIDSVYEALTEQGYNPISQIVGYVMSGDPTYITSHNGARSLIMKVERDEIIEELLQDYIKHHF